MLLSQLWPAAGRAQTTPLQRYFQHRQLVTSRAAVREAPGLRPRDQLRLEVYRDQLQRLLVGKETSRAQALALKLERLSAKAGLQDLGAEARRIIDGKPIKLSGSVVSRSSGRRPLLTIPTKERLKIRLYERGLEQLQQQGASRARIERQLLKLARLYEASNLLQEAAWTYQAAGEGYAAEAQRVEQQLQRLLDGPIRALHSVAIGSQRLQLAELAGGVFAVFKTKRSVEQPGQSEFPEHTAFQLDRHYGFNLIPVTARRSGKHRVRGKEGTLQYFFKFGSTLKELKAAWGEKSEELRTLHRLVGNYDGHGGNIFVLPLGREAAIDNEESFYWRSGLQDFRIQDPHLRQKLSRLDRDQLTRLVGLTLGDHLIWSWSRMLAAQ